MKKIILVDGNNLLFRSYYATAYNGNFMKNSKGFPTNALFGFHNMLTKIIAEEKPEYMIVAFDKGKTFRHEEYKDYKGGRIQTPDELKQQFPVAKEIAKAMGIPCFEIDDYEADDIIGTFAKEVDKREDFVSTIISSDKDLLQLISDDNEVKLLKMNDFIRLDKQAFIDQAILHEMTKDDRFRPARYQLSMTASNQKGVYTFCMCPGGLVIPCSSSEGKLVVNGMSYAARDGENANSALLVQVNEKDYGTKLFAGLEYQEALEKKAFSLGKDYRACVQLSKDYMQGI